MTDHNAHATRDARDARYALMRHWLDTVLPETDWNLAPASADASFRRYFRIRSPSFSRIVMDAPPEQGEDCRAFVAIGRALAELGLQTPAVYAADYAQGFLLLSDLGERQYLAALNESTVESLYDDALTALARLQIGGDPATLLLPRYDADLLRRELELFRDWFLLRHQGLALGVAEIALLEDAFALLCANALEQPQVWVHRDYHSRNLMLTEQANPGVLDFQGAVIGPLTYDLVSLLRDCYIAWPRQHVERWALDYRARLLAQGFAGLVDEATFLRWFDLMGLQRHLKAIGIFARLHHRDGKPGYLQDIPRTLGYVLGVAADYPALTGLRAWLLERGVTPAGVAALP